MNVLQIKLISEDWKPEQLIGKVSSEEQVKPCIEWYIKEFLYNQNDIAIQWNVNSEDGIVTADVYLGSGGYGYSNTFKFKYYPVPEIDPHLKHHPTMKALENMKKCQNGTTERDTLLGVIENLLFQISQMRGMFKDEDNQIQEAMNEAEIILSKYRK